MNYLFDVFNFTWYIIVLLVLIKGRGRKKFMFIKNNDYLLFAWINYIRPIFSFLNLGINSGEPTDQSESIAGGFFILIIVFGICLFFGITCIIGTIRCFLYGRWGLGIVCFFVPLMGTVMCFLGKEKIQNIGTASINMKIEQTEKNDKNILVRCINKNCSKPIGTDDDFCNFCGSQQN